MSRVVWTYLLKDHRVLFAGAPAKVAEKLKGETFELPAGRSLPNGAVCLLANSIAVLSSSQKEEIDLRPDALGHLA